MGIDEKEEVKVKEKINTETGIQTEVKKKLPYRLCQMLLIFCCLLFPYIQAGAESDFSDYETGKHPLIQATNVVEEYEALVRLGFFSTGEWGEAARSQSGVSESGAEEETEYKTEAQRLFTMLAKESASEKACAAIVQINMGTYYGSGVLWDIREDNLVIASNAHLLKEGKSGEVIFRSGTKAEGVVAGFSDTRDIGFMEVPLLELDREEWLLLRFADKNLKNYDALLAGDELFVIGSATGAGQDYYEGTVGKVSYYFPEFQSDMLYGYCKAVSGMSGGGTFDRAGHFIGMLTAGTKEEEIASLPVAIVMEEYKKIYEDREKNH